ncbi:MAG: hypothetical protein ABEH40_03290 [Haloferacaceae archaeon]
MSEVVPEISPRTRKSIEAGALVALLAVGIGIGGMDPGEVPFALPALVGLGAAIYRFG